MSVDKLDSIAVLAPVELNDSSLRQLGPVDKVEQKELAPPIFHSIDADFYNFNFFNNTVGGNDYSLDTFLSLPFTADEVMEEGGGLAFHQVEDEEDGLSEGIAINFDEKETGLGNGNLLSPEPDSNSTPVNDPNKVVIKKKVYQCQEPGCDTWFVRASRFHEHVMSHKNVRPFRCSACPYQTKWKSDVKKHIKKQISKGDQTHVNGRMIVSNDYEKDKLKGYNIFYVEKLIHCTDGTNKVPETGTSRNCVRDPSDPEPPPLPIVKVPTLDRSNSSISNGKNKKKKSEGGKKIKLENNLSSPANDPNQIPQESKNNLPGVSLQNLLGLGLGQAQRSTSDTHSEPIFIHRTLPIPVQEFTHLVGFNKY